MGRRFGAKWLVVALACLFVAALGTGQIHRVEATLIRSANHALARNFGPDVSIGGVPQVHLLPRPYVVLTDVRLSGIQGGSDLVIPRLEATQSAGSLFSGRLAFSRLRLIAPSLTVDIDALRTESARSALGLFGRTFPGHIAIEDGVLTLRSRHAALNGVMRDVRAAIDGIDHNGAATLSGYATWRGERFELTARLQPFFDFMLARATTGTVKLRSPLISASVEGQLHSGIRGGFEGEVSASTSTLHGLLQTVGLPGSLGQVVEHVSFSGSGVANPDTITFSDARVALDDTPFEGSLAWQPNDGHWAWTGTFATDTLDLNRGLAALPVLRDRHGHWSETPLTIDPALLGDIDLRISAAHALLGPLTIEDAAFSALCRDGRIEAGFSEARSLDGLIRGRAVAAVAGRSVDLRIDLSMSQMDLDPLAQAVGTRGISGSASGRLVAEARGTSPKALVESLAGKGQISVRNGSLPSLPSIADLSGLGLDAPAWLRSRTALPFDLATADLSLTGNRLTIVDGRVVEAGGQQAFSAEASLLDRSFSVQAMPTTGEDSLLTHVSGILGSPPRITRASTDDSVRPNPAAHGVTAP